MKKTFVALLTFLVAAMTSQGASIKWSIGGAIDTSSSIDTSVGSFILAYIGVTDGTGIDANTFKSGVGTSYLIKDTGTWGDFENTTRHTYQNARSITTTGDTNGDTYQIFYTNDSGDYFLVNDMVTTIKVSVDGAGAASVVPYNNGTAGSGTTAYATGSARTAITSVPEPSVALMGLLGLGMLLKRRKA